MNLADQSRLSDPANLLAWVFNESLEFAKFGMVSQVEVWIDWHYEGCHLVFCDKINWNTPFYNPGPNWIQEDQWHHKTNP